MRAAVLVTSIISAPGVALAGMQCSAPAQDLSNSVSSIAASAPAAPPRLAGPWPAAAAVTAEEITRVPALRRIASGGAELSDLGVEHGLRGIFARAGERFQVFYLAPDGQAVIGGVMWDAAGQNVTRRQVAPIEGTVPTVTIGSTGPTRQPVATVQAAPVDLLAQVEQTNFGTAGPNRAPRLWMFADPLCGHSVQAMERLRPLLGSGQLELAVIPVAILDHEDGGQSALQARLMLSQTPQAMVEAWAGGKLAGEPDAAADAKLAANMAAARAIGLRGTPTFVWRKADGSAGRSDGLPPDLAVIIASLAN